MNSSDTIEKEYKEIEKQLCLAEELIEEKNAQIEKLRVNLINLKPHKTNVIPS